MSYARRLGAGPAQSVRAYADIGLETRVLGASPQRLITLLFDGARAAIGQARLYLEQGNVAARGAAISKAVEIIDGGLKASLDMEAGGTLAENLRSVYDAVIRSLLQANLKADAGRLELADRLLAEIGEAWRVAVDAPGPAPAPADAAGGPFSAHT